MLNKLLKQLVKLIVKTLELIFQLIEWLIQLFLKGCRKFSKFVLKLKWYSYLLSFIGLFATIWGFYTYYYPEISMTYTNPIDKTDLFTSKFTIENNGNCNIYDVTLQYEMVKLTLENEKGEQMHLSGNKIIHNWKKKLISSKRNQVIDIDIFKEGYVIRPRRSDEKIYIANAVLKIQLKYTYWNDIVKIDTFNFITQSSKINKSVIWLNNQ